MLVLAFLIGVADGLRSATPPAVLAWAAHLGWIDLHGSPLSFMGSWVAVALFTVFALVELVGDKLPSTPSRTKPAGLIARCVLGGFSGALIGAAGSQSVPLAAVLGAIGGIAGAFGGYQARTRLVRTLRVPDYIIACAEDVVAIGGSLLIVSRLA